MTEEFTDQEWLAQRAEPQSDDEWLASRREKPDASQFFNMPESEREQAKLSPSIGSIAKAFGSDFSEAWGPDRLGLTDQSKEFLARYGALPKDGHEDFSLKNPLAAFKNFEQGIILPLAAGLDAIARTPGAVYRGLQGAGAEAGLPGDIVSIPDAFLGMPHPFGIPRLAQPQPFVKPSPVRPVEFESQGIKQPIEPIARSRAAQTGLPEVDAVLNSPTTKTAIDNAVIDRSHDVPYMAGGSVPLEDPTVYIDSHVPREQTAPRLSGEGTVTFDPADPWTVHENVEQHTMELLIRGGMSDQEAYRVAHFEYAEKAEQAWYRAHDIDQEAAEREQMTWLPRIQHENPKNPPPNLYKKPYPHDSVEGAQHESVVEAPPTTEEIGRARQIIANRGQELQTGGIVAYHGSPHDFDKFSTSAIGTGEGAQAYGHGLYFAENPAVAEDYKKALAGKSNDVSEQLAQQSLNYSLDPKEAAQALRNRAASERREPFSSIPPEEMEKAASLLEGGWRPSKGEMYRVSINADPEHFLDWDKPLSEQSPHVQKAFEPFNLKDTEEGGYMHQEI